MSEETDQIKDSLKPTRRELLLAGASTLIATAVASSPNIVHAASADNVTKADIEDQSRKIADLKDQVNALGASVVDDVGLNLLDSARVAVLNRNADNKFLNFAFITDTHVNGVDANGNPYHSTDNIELFGIVCNERWLDFGAFGGDIYTAYSLTREQALKELDAAMQLFGEVRIPLYFAKGNHDANAKYMTVVEDYESLDWENTTYYAWSNAERKYMTISESDWEAAGRPELHVGGVMSQDECLTRFQYYTLTQNRGYESIVVNSEDRFGAYFYRDFVDEKVRVVILNYFDLDKLEETGVHGRQLKWFAEKALNLDGKDDYVVLVIMHMYPKDSADPFNQVLGAFNSGLSVSVESTDPTGTYSISVDYSHQGSGRLVAIVHGHEHSDKFEKINGCNIVGVERGYAFAEESDEDEFAFSLFTVDTDARILYEQRVGRGENRSFGY